MVIVYAMLSLPGSETVITKVKLPPAEIVVVFTATTALPGPAVSPSTVPDDAMLTSDPPVVRVWVFFYHDKVHGVYPEDRLHPPRPRRAAASRLDDLESAAVVRRKFDCYRGGKVPRLIFADKRACVRREFQVWSGRLILRGPVRYDAAKFISM